MNNLQYEEKNLHSADDWEASEQSECSPDGREFVDIFSFLVLNIGIFDFWWKKLLIIINLLTLVTLSNVEVSKKILTKWSLLLNFKSLKIILIYISYFCFLFLPLRSYRSFLKYVNWETVGLLYLSYWSLSSLYAALSWALSEVLTTFTISPSHFSRQSPSTSISATQLTFSQRQREV